MTDLRSPSRRRLAFPFSFFLLLAPSAGNARSPPEDAPQTAPSQADQQPSRARRAPLSPYLIDTGPIRVRDQFPLSIGLLAFDPVGAETLDPGVWQIDVISTLTNTFATSRPLEEALDARTSRVELNRGFLERFDETDPGKGAFAVDAELVRTAVAMRRGIGRGVQLELVLPVLDYTRGFLDGTIESFHDLFGFAEDGRRGAERNRLLVASRSPAGALTLDRDPGPVLGDIVFGAKFRLLDEPQRERLLIALETLIELPTGSGKHLASNGSADFGARLVGSYTLGRLRLHGSAGLVALGEWEEAGLSPQLLPSGMIALELSVGRRSSGLLQLTASRTPFSDLQQPELSETTIQATAGIKRVVLGGNVLFVALTENIQNYDNSQDIGIHLGFTRVF